MPCLPSFKVVCNQVTIVTINGRTKIDSSYEDFIEVLKLFLRGTDIDEKWYLTKYPDVASAVKAGAFRSGHHHFVEVGYFEGRRPRDFEVDETWYIATYPDVADGIDTNKIGSARQHFNEHGYDEGRKPAEE